jgi:L-asparagine transporter-like permease
MGILAIPLVSYLMMLPVLVIMVSLGYDVSYPKTIYIWFVCIVVYTIVYVYFKRRR